MATSSGRWAWASLPTLTAELVAYLRAQGRHKVMFGSNHPAWPAVECLEGLDQLGLDGETLAAFLHGNAERAFGLDAMS
jgi:uncharacterized protein